MGQIGVILCTVIVSAILVFGSVFEEYIIPAAESQLPTTLKILKFTTGGDDTFDFTVTGPTSYNPSINTASGGTSTITKLIMDTFPQNNDDGTADCVTCDIGQSGIIVQEIILNNEKISELTVRHLDDQFNTAGTVTAKIWSGITDGGLFEDAVIEDSSDVYDFSTETRHSTSGSLYQIFNFTTPVALTGTYFVGIEWENVDDDIQIDDMTTNGGGGFVGATPYRLEDQQTPTGCLVAEGTVGSTFTECSVVFSGGPELLGMDLAIQKEVPDITVLTGIQTSNLKGYYTFDASETVETSILLNAGTLGHLADGHYLRDNDANDNLDIDTFDSDLGADGTVGIFGDALGIQSTGGGGGVHELMRFGTTANEFDWDFLTSSSTNNVTISFWLKADQCCNPNEPLPVLSSNGYSMVLGISNTNPYILIFSADAPNPNIPYTHQFTNLTVAGDSNFHNVVYRIDKTGSSDTITVCVDGTSNCEGDGITGFDFPEDGEITSSDRSKSLTVGEKGHNLESVISGFTFDVDTVFDIDDLCIWDAYIDDTDIDTIYNGGSGNPCATVTSGGGGGMGMDGPTPVDPGTYSIQETIPAGWMLNAVTCNDGSSSFSVDTVSGIVIAPGDNTECTFENEFAISPDTDGDGIYNEIDTLPTTFSDDFSDIALGGTSSGTITTRGDQILTITKEPNPAGVRIIVDIPGGLLPAVVNACGGISIITLSPGDNIVVTCGSITIDVTNGPVETTFISSQGIQATTTLTTGNSITFDQDTFSFSTPSTNIDPVVVIVEEGQIILSPSQAASVLSSNKDSFIKQGELNTNEGTNMMMRVRDNGNNRALVSFDQNEILAAAQERTLSSATLRLYIEENGNNWGPDGRTIDIHRLVDDWTEGNGFNDKPESMSLSQFNELKTRGDGPGVTWKCATDTEIINQQTDCSLKWNGATFNLTPTDTITIFKDNPPTGTIKTVGWIELDVTSDLQAFLSDAEQNYGWIVKKTEEGAPGLVEFTSDESAINMPELVLVFD